MHAGRKASPDLVDNVADDDMKSDLAKINVNIIDQFAD